MACAEMQPRRKHRQASLLIGGFAAISVSVLLFHSSWTTAFAVSAWNFAYGSNMDKFTRARRQLEPTQTLPAVADGWELWFSLPGLPFLEPAFATLRPSSNISTHGVCLELDKESWFRLLASEGVLGAAEISDLRLRGASLEEVLEEAAKKGQDVRGYRLLPIEAGCCQVW